MLSRRRDPLSILKAKYLQSAPILLWRGEQHIVSLKWHLKTTKLSCFDTMENMLKNELLLIAYRICPVIRPLKYIIK